MTKALVVDPGKKRKSGVLKLGEIPVNQYKRTIKQELSAKSPITEETCLRIYRNMAVIREFETMLDNIKKLGSYQGIEYSHAGPAHLSIGQEGAAVGECVYLGVEDHIFGSHRSHGEIIAKGLRAVEDLAGSGLMPIVEGYWDGAILKVVQDYEPDWTGLSFKAKGKKKPFFATS